MYVIMPVARCGMICFKSTGRESDSWLDSLKSPFFELLIWIELICPTSWFELPFLKWVAIIWKKKQMVAKITLLAYSFISF